MTSPLSKVGMTVAAAAVAMFFSSAASAAEELSIGNVPYFPLRVGPSVVTEQVSLPDESVLYRQALHPVAGIRITAPLSLHYAAGMLMGGKLDVTVPAGTVFLSTIFGKSLYFCSAQSLQNSFLLGIVEVGVCLRDGDGNGVADQQIVLTNGRKIGVDRVQNIFELLGEQRDAPVTQISVTYEKVPLENLPTLDLKMSMRRAAGLFDRSSSIVVLQLCVPPEISTAPQDGIRCAYVDWKKDDVVDLISGTTVGGRVQFDKDVAEVKWGPITLSLQRQAGDAVLVKSTKTLPSGVLALIGTYRLEQSGQSAAVVDFLAVPPLPALMEIGDIR
jgi:hypothetical protein